jgi:RNA polymerase sigma-70 factor (ECF subfamily)
VVLTSRRHPRPDPADDGGRHADLTATVAAAVAGDEEAFRRLYREIQPAILRYLRVLVGVDAEDVASETWLQVCRDLHRFRGDIDGLRAWCATVARHRALDHLRRVRRRPQTPWTEEQLAGLASSADTAASATDALDTGWALSLIASLPPDQAEAVLLRVVVGLDVASAARVLGKRPGAVRTACHRGLRRLADVLEHRHA